jgi:hypothetical protein
MHYLYWSYVVNINGKILSLYNCGWDLLL